MRGISLSKIPIDIRGSRVVNVDQAGRREMRGP
jgi:hypothetical protein